MGRPIKKKFFGNLYDNQAVNGFSGIGGEGVASVRFTNSGTLYSQGTTVSFSAPTIVGGVLATGTPVIDAAGLLRGVTITNAGSGYSAAPTLTVTTASQVTQYVTNSGVSATNTLSVASVVGIQIGMRIYGGGNGGLVTAVDPVLNRVTSSLPNDTSWTNANNLKFYDQGSGQINTVTLKTTNASNDSILFTSYLTTGSSAISGGDIIKQESSRRYLVRNAQGVGVCHLSSGTGVNHILTPGNMHIVATDTTGATYYVLRLAARKALVFNRTNTSTAVYKSFKNVPWDTRAAYVSTSGAVVVSIPIAP